MTRPRRISTVLLALGAASALAVAGVGLPWWSTPDVSIGPTYSMTCFGGDCQRTSLDWIGDGTWIRLGVVTWGAGLIAAACLVALAAGVASGRAARLLSKMTLTSTACATGVAAAFVAEFPGGGMTTGMHAAVGAYLHFAGVLVAAAAAMVALRGARATVPG